MRLPHTLLATAAVAALFSSPALAQNQPPLKVGLMLPLSGPMLATVGLFTAITAWNSFFIPLVFTLGRPELRTLAIGMYAFIGENSTEWTLLCAGTVITLAPIVLLFLLLQRFFVNGLAGAVKQ